LTSDEALHLQTVATDSKRFGSLNVAPPTNNDLGDSVEYNQLKFVCRKLYAETAGLELKYNDIVICGDAGLSDEGPARKFLQWREDFDPAKLSWLKLKTITLTFKIPESKTYSMLFPEFPESPETFAALAAVCKVNPDMMVRHEMPGWALGIPFDVYTLACTFAFRGHDEFEQLHGCLRLHRGSLYNNYQAISGGVAERYKDRGSKCSQSANIP
jgi:hypothetical protein